MKKAIYIAGIVAAGLVLAACNKLTQYTITEQDMNQYLQKYNNFQKQIGISGLVDADITVDQLNSQIGRTDPNKVTLMPKSISAPFSAHKPAICKSRYRLSRFITASKVPFSCGIWN